MKEFNFSFKAEELIKNKDLKSKIKGSAYYLFISDKLLNIWSSKNFKFKKEKNKEWVQNIEYILN